MGPGPGLLCHSYFLVNVGVAITAFCLSFPLCNSAVLTAGVVQDPSVRVVVGIELVSKRKSLELVTSM